MLRWSKAWTRAAKVGKDLFKNKKSSKVGLAMLGRSMLRGQRPLALILSAQQRFPKAKVVSDAAARVEIVKWDDGLLLRLKTKLGIRLLGLRVGLITKNNTVIWFGAVSAYQKAKNVRGCGSVMLQAAEKARDKCIVLLTAKSVLLEGEREIGYV
ncbi:hypothetical protein Tco_1466073 [Tanacetum coccineum]